jgi:hypothetical protein
MHWHDALVLHAPILQYELLAGLKRFDQQADKTRYLISWKFSPDCGCPHTQMPDPTSWNDPTTVKLGPVSAHPVQPNARAARANASFELPPAAPEDDDDDDQGFAATQIHDIRP